LTGTCCLLLNFLINSLVLNFKKLGIFAGHF
jgi:hypothetical protein